MFTPTLVPITILTVLLVYGLLSFVFDVAKYNCPGILFVEIDPVDLNPKFAFIL